MAQMKDEMFKNRCELLHLLSVMKVPMRTRIKMLEPMEGKTNEEKEQIAAQLMEQMKAEAE